MTLDDNLHFKVRDVCKQKCLKYVLHVHVQLHEFDDKSEHTNQNFVFKMKMFQFSRISIYYELNILIS